MSNDTIITELVAYNNEADIEYEGGEIVNHDELVKNGQTYMEVRALADTEKNRRVLSDSVIITEDDPSWEPRFAEMDVGDTIRRD